MLDLATLALPFEPSKALLSPQTSMQAVEQRISWLVGLAFPKILRLVAEVKQLEEIF